jgi:hypothetical protein
VQAGADTWLAVGVEFQFVMQEQAAVEKRDAAGQGFGLRATLIFGPGEGIEEQGVEEFAEEAVFPACA